ncbi:hypothetical protein ACFY7A_30995 [Streptomyces longwoodensis]|uniref:hypothetical protein n=1 Tax=Streptomyces longwoodensis TaxID=68231 RepID=UPI0036CB682D
MTAAAVLHDLALGETPLPPRVLARREPFLNLTALHPTADGYRLGYLPALTSATG